MIHDSEEDVLTPEVITRHYSGRFDHNSDSAHSAHSGLDEEEEEKMEQEITSRLSHLTIHREMDYKEPFILPRNEDHYHWDPRSPANGYHDGHGVDHEIHDKEYDLNLCTDNDSLVTELYGDAKGAFDDEADDGDIRVDVGCDEQMEDHYHQSLYDKHCGLCSDGSPRGAAKDYRLSINGEFLSNETFIKYAMLYGTIYCISKLTLNRLYNRSSPTIQVDADSISRKLVLISNAVVSVFKGYQLGIGNAPHKAMLSPFKELLLTENEANFLDIQKAFNFIMILLSCFGGGAKRGGQRMSRSVQRVYNLICIGCIVLIKKYKKLGGLYIYTAFWMQLSAFFMDSGKVLSTMGSLKRMDSALMRRGGALSKVIYALLTIYSRIYLFSKVMTPIIQQYWRSGSGMVKPYAGSLASIAFLVSGYYRTGDGLIKNFRGSL